MNIFFKTGKTKMDWTEIALKFGVFKAAMMWTGVCLLAGLGARIGWELIDIAWIFIETVKEVFLK